MRHLCTWIRTTGLACLASVCLSVSAAPATDSPATPAVTPTVAAMGLIGTSADAVSRFLQDSGVLAAANANGAPLIDQVRDKASDLVMSAMNFLGVPYRRGGTSADSGFDCSGFTRHVFENSVGLLLPRRSRDQASSPNLLNVQREDLKPGDLVFFNTMRSAFSHVGIYLGDGKFIHSPRTGSEVRVEDMREAYWTKRFNGARRAPGAGMSESGLGALPGSLSSQTLSAAGNPDAGGRTTR